jgi:DNA-binding LytR/AlgR family response regulator
MRPLHVIAIDDEPIAHEVLSFYSSQLKEITLRRQFTSSDQARHYLMCHNVDLILLDIEMAEVNGLEFYRSLPIKPMVIFTTAYPNYAVDGFNVAAMDYLLKPFSAERFEQAIAKAALHCKMTESNTDSCLYVRSDYQTKKIPFTDILFIEGLNNYVKIYTQSSDKPVLSMISMKEVTRQLPDQQFFRIHRSYIVSRKRITAIGSRYLQLEDRQLPIGDTYRHKIHLWRRTS